MRERSGDCWTQRSLLCLYVNLGRSERYKKPIFRRIQCRGHYVAGKTRIYKDGLFLILCRLDDVLNAPVISSGTAETESSLVS